MHNVTLFKNIVLKIVLLFLFFFCCFFLFLSFSFLSSIFSNVYAGFLLFWGFVFVCSFFYVLSNLSSDFVCLFCLCFVYFISFLFLYHRFFLIILYSTTIVQFSFIRALFYIVIVYVLYFGSHYFGYCVWVKFLFGREAYVWNCMIYFGYCASIDCGILVPVLVGVRESLHFNLLFVFAAAKSLCFLLICGYPGTRRNAAGDGPNLKIWQVRRRRCHICKGMMTRQTPIMMCATHYNLWLLRKQVEQSSRIKIVANRWPHYVPCALCDAGTFVGAICQRCHRNKCRTLNGNQGSATNSDDVDLINKMVGLVYDDPGPVIKDWMAKYKIKSEDKLDFLSMIVMQCCIWSTNLPNPWRRSGGHPPIKKRMQRVTEFLRISEHCEHSSTANVDKLFKYLKKEYPNLSTYPSTPWQDKECRKCLFVCELGKTPNIKHVTETTSDAYYQAREYWNLYELYTESRLSFRYFEWKNCDYKPKFVDMCKDRKGTLQLENVWTSRVMSYLTKASFSDGVESEVEEMLATNVKTARYKLHHDLAVSLDLSEGGHRAVTIVRHIQNIFRNQTKNEENSVDEEPSEHKDNFDVEMNSSDLDSVEEKEESLPQIRTNEEEEDEKMHCEDLETPMQAPTLSRRSQYIEVDKHNYEQQALQCVHNFNSWVMDGDIFTEDVTGMDLNEIIETPFGACTRWDVLAEKDKAVCQQQLAAKRALEEEKEKVECVENALNIIITAALARVIENKISQQVEEEKVDYAALTNEFGREIISVIKHRPRGWREKLLLYGVDTHRNRDKSNQKKRWCYEIKLAQFVDEVQTRVGEVELSVKAILAKISDWVSRKETPLSINPGRWRIKNGSIEENCPICLSPNNTCESTCGHQFHATCLDRWINGSEGRHNCPMCRQTLNVETKGSEFNMRTGVNINHQRIFSDRPVMLLSRDRPPIAVYRRRIEYHVIQVRMLVSNSEGLLEPRQFDTYPNYTISDLEREHNVSVWMITDHRQRVIYSVDQRQVNEAIARFENDPPMSLLLNNPNMSNFETGWIQILAHHDLAEHTRRREARQQPEDYLPCTPEGSEVEDDNEHAPVAGSAGTSRNAKGDGPPMRGEDGSRLDKKRVAEKRRQREILKVPPAERIGFGRIASKVRVETVPELLDPIPVERSNMVNHELGPPERLQVFEGTRYEDFGIHIRKNMRVLGNLNYGTIYWVMGNINHRLMRYIEMHNQRSVSGLNIPYNNGVNYTAANPFASVCWVEARHDYKAKKGGKLLLFGDNVTDYNRAINVARTGWGGLAAVVGHYDRSCAIGVTTCGGIVSEIIKYQTRVLTQLATHCRLGADIYIPASCAQPLTTSMGTGIAMSRLDGLSPQHLYEMNQCLNELPGSHVVLYVDDMPLTGALNDESDDDEAHSSEEKKSKEEKSVHDQPIDEYEEERGARGESIDTSASVSIVENNSSAISSAAPPDLFVRTEEEKDRVKEEKEKQRLKQLAKKYVPITPSPAPTHVSNMLIPPQPSVEPSDGGFDLAQANQSDSTNFWLTDKEQEFYKKVWNEDWINGDQYNDSAMVDAMVWRMQSELDGMIITETQNNNPIISGYGDVVGQVPWVTHRCKQNGARKVGHASNADHPWVTCQCVCDEKVIVKQIYSMSLTDIYKMASSTQNGRLWSIHLRIDQPCTPKDGELCKTVHWMHDAASDEMRLCIGRRGEQLLQIPATYWLFDRKWKLMVDGTQCILSYKIIRGNHGVDIGLFNVHPMNLETAIFEGVSRINPQMELQSQKVMVEWIDDYNKYTIWCLTTCYSKRKEQVKIWMPNEVWQEACALAIGEDRDKALFKKIARFLARYLANQTKLRHLGRDQALVTTVMAYAALVTNIQNEWLIHDKWVTDKRPLIERHKTMWDQKPRYIPWWFYVLFVGIVFIGIQYAYTAVDVSTYSWPSVIHFTGSPTASPTWAPTQSPTQQPSAHPFKTTTRKPTTKPNMDPTTRKPTKHPTTKTPTTQPTSRAPTMHPSSNKPSKKPTYYPTTRRPTTIAPSQSPTQPPSTFDGWSTSSTEEAPEENIGGYLMPALGAVLGIFVVLLCGWCYYHKSRNRVKGRRVYKRLIEEDPMDFRSSGEHQRFLPIGHGFSVNDVQEEEQ